MNLYNLLEFDGKPTIVNKLETAFRRDEKVLRFLTFRLDKYAEEYAIKRRSLKKNAPKQEETKEVVEQAPEAEEKKAETPEAAETANA